MSMKKKYSGSLAEDHNMGKPRDERAAIPTQSTFEVNFFMNNWNECQSLSRRGDVAEKAWTYFTDPDRCDSDKPNTMCLQDIIRFCFELFKAFPENQNHKKNIAYDVWEKCIREVAQETAYRITEDLDEEEDGFVRWELFRNFFIDSVGPDSDFSELTLETYGGSVDRLNCPADLQGIREPQLEARRSIERAVIKYKIGQFYLKYVQWQCNEMKAVLQKEPWQRSASQLAIIYDMVKEVPFIQSFSLPKEDLMDVCRHLKYMQLEREQELFHQGDMDGRFFMILQGTILIKVKAELGHFSEEQVVSVLERGESFGQRSLLEKDPRKGTAITFTHTKLCYLDAEAFECTIRKQQQRLMQKRIDVISNVEALSTCTEDQIHQLAQVCVTREFRQDEVILQQGDPSEDVYILQSGRCRVIQEIAAGKIGMHDRRGNVFLDVNELGPHSLFGEIGVLKHCARTASVMTLSPCVVYILRKTDFIRRIGKKALHAFGQVVASYPTPRQLGVMLNQTNRWHKYREQLTDISRDTSVPKYSGAADLPTYPPLQQL